MAAIHEHQGSVDEREVPLDDAASGGGRPARPYLYALLLLGALAVGVLAAHLSTVGALPFVGTDPLSSVFGGEERTPYPSSGGDSAAPAALEGLAAQKGEAGEGPAKEDPTERGSTEKGPEGLVSPAYAEGGPEGDDAGEVGEAAPASPASPAAPASPEREEPAVAEPEEPADERPGSGSRGPADAPVKSSDDGNMAATEREVPEAAPPADRTLYLTVPKLGIRGHTVKNDKSEETMGLGAIKLPDTGFPWEEKDTNTYIACHRVGFAGTESFNQCLELPSMTAGDEISLTDANGTSYEYRVTETRDVTPKDHWIKEPVAGKDVISLQTCTETLGDYATMGPNWTARFVVQAERV